MSKFRAVTTRAQPRAASTPLPARPLPDARDGPGLGAPGRGKWQPHRAPHAE